MTVLSATEVPPREGESPPPAAKSLTVADLRAYAPAARTVLPVPIPALGGVVHVRSLTGLELDKFDDAITDEKGKPIVENYRAKWVCACLCDAGGQPVFALTPEHVSEVGGWDGPSLIDPIYEAAVRLNRRRAADRAEQKKD